jgi:large subunit ribosomal protein L2
MFIQKLKEVGRDLYRWVVLPYNYGFKRGVGRSNQGRITSYHLGGGHKRNFRLIFWGFKGISRCLGIYFDPNRRAYLALMQPVVSVFKFVNPVFWVLAPKGISKNFPFNTISCFYFLKLEFIDRLIFFARKELHYFVLQQEVHSISIFVNNLVGFFVRSGGCSAVISSFITDIKVVVLLLPSGKLCYLVDKCAATGGRVSNSSHYLKKLYKAGQRRWLGRRPIVRGVAINPVDHPHGGRTRGGRPSVSPWGKLTKVQCKLIILFLLCELSDCLFYLIFISSYYLVFILVTGVVWFPLEFFL